MSHSLNHDDSEGKLEDKLSLQQENRELKALLAQSKQSTKNLEQKFLAELSSAKRVKNALAESLKRVEDELEETKKSSTVSRINSGQSSTEVRALRESNSALTASLNEMRQKLSESEKMREALMRENETLLDQVNSLSSTRESDQQRISHLENEMASLSKSEAAMSAIIQAKKYTDDRASRMEAKLISLHKMKESLKAGLLRRDAEYKKLVDENEQLKKDVESLRSDALMLRLSGEESNETVDTLRRQLSVLKLEHEERGAELEALVERNEINVEDLSQERDRNEALQRELDKKQEELKKMINFLKSHQQAALYGNGISVQENSGSSNIDFTSSDAGSAGMGDRGGGGGSVGNGSGVGAYSGSAGESKRQIRPPRRMHYETNIGLPSTPSGINSATEALYGPSPSSWQQQQWQGSSSLNNSAASLLSSLALVTQQRQQQHSAPLSSSSSALVPPIVSQTSGNTAATTTTASSSSSSSTSTPLAAKASSNPLYSNAYFSIPSFSDLGWDRSASGVAATPTPSATADAKVTSSSSLCQNATSASVSKDFTAAAHSGGGGSEGVASAIFAEGESDSDSDDSNIDSGSGGGSGGGSGAGGLQSGLQSGLQVGPCSTTAAGNVAISDTESAVMLLRGQHTQQLEPGTATGAATKGAFAGDENDEEDAASLAGSERFSGSNISDSNHSTSNNSSSRRQHGGGNRVGNPSHSQQALAAAMLRVSALEGKVSSLTVERLELQQEMQHMQAELSMCKQSLESTQARAQRLNAKVIQLAHQEDRARTLVEQLQQAQESLRQARLLLSKMDRDHLRQTELVGRVKAVVDQYESRCIGQNLCMPDESLVGDIRALLFKRSDPESASNDGDDGDDDGQEGEVEGEDEGNRGDGGDDHGQGGGHGVDMKSNKSLGDDIFPLENSAR